MASATETGRRLPGDPEVPDPVPWFIAAARADPKEQLRATTSPPPPPLPVDGPPTLHFREAGARPADDIGLPPPPVAAAQSFAGHRSRQPVGWVTGGLVGVVLAVAAGWLARDLSTVREPQVEQTMVAPASVAPVDAVPVAPTLSDPLAPLPAVEPTQLFPDEVVPAEAPAAFDDAPPTATTAAAPPVVRPPPPTTIARIAPPAPREARREALRAARTAAAIPAPVAVEAAPVVVVGNCDPAAPSGSRLLCGDATLKALDNDLNAVNAEVRVLALAAGDTRMLERLARGDASFAERRDRCTTARCVADKYDDRLSDVEAMKRRLERGQGAAGVAGQATAELPDCKGFQIYRPTAPCVIRGRR